MSHVQNRVILRFVMGLSFCLLSCGLEDYLYIAPIPESVVTGNSAKIQLPSSSDEGYSNYFSRFAIFYRIYISSQQLTTITSNEERGQINSSLASDYTSLYYLTDKNSTSVIPANLETTFYNRNYFKLALSGNDLNNVLDNSSLGKTLEIYLEKQAGISEPALTLNGTSYTLQRANTGQGTVFRPVPENRYFFNHPDLYDTSNLTNEKNADVAANSNTQNQELKYTYVSMYIFAVGKDYLSTIYSQPTHIGIFRLPEAD
ncbi:MAG: hypothetical protein LBU85_08580 [Treponema sp.]|jgi:hypothetical protein|nr:hypothetical protein [Treponema sp.]